MIEEFKTNQMIMDEIKKSASASYRRQRIAELYEDGAIIPLLPTYFTLWKTRCQDLTFTINELYRLAKQPDWEFAEVLDLDRLAAIGYSLGGEAVSQTCVTEHRIKIGVALDSDLWGYLLGQSVSQPFSVFTPKIMNAKLNMSMKYSRLFCAAQTSQFWNRCLWWELQGRADLIGDLPAARCHEIIRRYILAFLNHICVTSQMISLFNQVVQCQRLII
jgi:hypothetical protein